MDKDYISKFLSIVTITAGTAYVCGSFIINTYLRHFQIVDFKLLQPHAIVVGFMFLIFLLIHAFVFLIFLDINHLGDNSLFKTIALSAIKVAFLSITITVLFDHEIIYSSLYTLRIFGYKIKIGLAFMFFLTYPITLILTHKDKTEYGNKNDFISKVYRFHNGLGLVSTGVLFLTFLNHPVFQSVLSLEIFLALIVVGAVMFISERKSSENATPGTMFSKSAITEKTRLNLLIVLCTVCLIPSILFTMVMYTESIYPRISQALGGGRPEQISYGFETKMITGKKIYESENYVFIQQSDSTIAKVEWADVRKIILNGK